MSSTSEQPGRFSDWLLRGFGAVVAILGLCMAAGGVQLAILGGSWYYLIAGAALLFAGVQLARYRLSGAWSFLVVFLGTLLWSVWEAGFDYWQWVPRLGWLLLLTTAFVLLLPRLDRRFPLRLSRALGGILALVFLGGLGLAFVPHGTITADVDTHTEHSGTVSETTDADWRHYGRTPDGTRYAPFEQINKTNVDQLELAWSFRTGATLGDGAEDQNTPMQVGDTLYVCTARNKVFALDADTGEQRWVFDSQAQNSVFARCRGLGYYELTEEKDSTAEVCSQRVMMNTVDARLIALDARTGTLCESFGEGGEVDLTRGMGEVLPGFYFQTSAPTVVRDLVVIGGWVFDNRTTDAPSGVVRAFSALTGDLVWAWDVGNPQVNEQISDELVFTRGTPNVWTAPAYDEALGLIYLPTGNSTPDFWGAHRTDVMEDYSVAVVAVDIETGRERWKYQFVHHDLWDYDLAAQPALHDVPDGKGGTVPALIQATKHGQIFMLDRRNGAPLAEVVEKPVPQGAEAGDWTSATQPYSVAMPGIGNERLTESRMWGITPFDQLWCRIAFNKLRYEGDFTPPTTMPSLQWPGFYGGMNWGSVAVNKDSHYLIVNDIRMGQVLQLIPRDTTDRILKEETKAAGEHMGVQPQAGTPFGIKTTNFLSPLGVPCQSPPFGTLTAIDLGTKQIAWQRPLGTVEDSRPLGFKLGLRIPLGMPTLSGSVTTRSGLIFYSGTQDYYLRAMDVSTGVELWKKRLPVGSQATPMTYVSPESGRQYVVVTAGGARTSLHRGDYILAYALPE